MPSSAVIFQNNIVNKTLEFEVLKGLLTISYEEQKLKWSFTDQFSNQKCGIDHCTYLQLNARLHIIFLQNSAIQGHSSYHLDMTENKIKIISSATRRTHRGKKIAVEIHCGVMKSR